MLHTAGADAHSKVVWSWEPDKQFTTGYLLLLFHLSFCLFIYLSVCMERQNCLIVLNSIIYGIYFITLGASRCIFNAFYMKWGCKAYYFRFKHHYRHSMLFPLYSISTPLYLVLYSLYSVLFPWLVYYWFILFIFGTFVVMIVTSFPCSRRVCR